MYAVIDRDSSRLGYGGERRYEDSEVLLDKEIRGAEQRTRILYERN